jgi:hypothetical protein
MYLFFQFNKVALSGGVLYRENFNSVKHVYIRTQQTLVHRVKYFPNATELTIRYFLNTIDNSIPKTLNYVLPNY